MTESTPVITTMPPRHADLLRDIAEQITRASDLDDTLHRLVEHLARNFGAEECHLFLIDGDRVTNMASHGVISPLPEHSVQELRSGLTGWALEHLQVATTTDTTLDDRNTGLARHRAELVGSRSCIVVPIPGREAAIGTITLLAPPGHLEPGPGEIESLERVSALAGAALVHARLRENERSARIEAEHQQSIARRLSTERDHTIAVIAHELRNALTTSYGTLEVLQEDDFITGLPDDVRDLIELAAVSAADAVSIVARLLRPSSADQTTDAIDVAHLAINAARATGVTFSGVEAGAHSRCPSVHVRQILRNLVANAQLHGGTSIGIDVQCRGDRVVIGVIDDGPGVPDGLSEVIFRPYVTTGETSGSRPSTGLGLSISRQLARQAGGDLAYVRADGLTRFELSLPVA